MRWPSGHSGIDSGGGFWREAELSKEQRLKDVSRRQILRLVAASGLGTLIPLACRTTPMTAAKWVEVHADPISAAQIGMLWLSAQRPQPSTEELIDTLAAPLDVESLNAGGIETIRSHILETHHADFAGGRVVLVAGWMLSVTEASLYGLIARLTTRDPR